MAIAATVIWWGWFNQWTKHRRAWLAAAIVPTVIGGGLIGAAYRFLQRDMVYTAQWMNLGQ